MQGLKLSSKLRLPCWTGNRETMMHHIDYAHHINDLIYISQGNMSKNDTKSKLYIESIATYSRIDSDY